MVAEAPALNAMEKQGPAPWPHPGGSSLTSGAGLWIGAMVSFALDRLPREIIIEQPSTGKPGDLRPLASPYTTSD